MYSSLIKLCRQGNNLAWSEFTDKFSRLIFWAIRHKAQVLQANITESDISDIYQQVLSAVWQDKKFKFIKSPKALPSWIFTVAKNTTADYIRKKNLIKNKETCHFQAARRPDAFAYNPYSELIDYIKLSIEKLPLTERRIATLNFVYELEYLHIARITDLPLGTVCSTIKRTKAYLQKCILKTGGIYEKS
ncbi:MAG: sigma-70 family RNA polymerase sigma factor [Candidatus Omnitrophica bacterium]|nr:sigma-70 family RNA polymerase sigma factor [Candidatus Omnitrophota bacterium]